MDAENRPFFGWSTAEQPASLQDPSELGRFIELLNSRSVTSYLEVGARYGGTFERIMSSLPIGSRGVAIDFPGAVWGDENSAGHLIAAILRLRKKGYQARAVFGPSSAPEVVKLATAQQSKFDAVLLDGDHSYEAIRSDFALYNPKGRLVALHDIAAPEGFANRAGDVVEVPWLWQELCFRYRNRLEIISPASVMGIGVILNDKDWRCPI